MFAEVRAKRAIGWSALLACVLVVAGWMAVPTAAQYADDPYGSEQPAEDAYRWQYDEEGNPLPATEVPNAGFWPTRKMIDGMIDRMTEEMAEHYEFDDDQLYLTREVIRERIPSWLKENRAEIQTLTNYYFEAILAGESPTVEDVAGWSQRVLPKLNEFRDVIGEVTGEMRTFMTEEQRTQLDGEMAAFDVGMQFMNRRLSVWAEGGYNPETDWFNAPGRHERDIEEQKRLAQEQEAARRAAMGGPGGPELVADEGPQSARLKYAGKAKDDWDQYVEKFIQRYQLNESQQNQALKILEHYKGERDQYLKRKERDFVKAEAAFKESDTGPAREKATKRLERLARPVERYFQQMKDRLDSLPTRAQRSSAAMAEIERRNKEREAEDKSE